MTPVDIYSLNGLPAPYWFIQLFKVLGFILHSVPMHLWLAGLPIAIILLLIGGINGQVFARRLLKQMPVIMAMGINLGIVPLLFIQAAYYKVFYPSTILIAWHWLGILALVLPAYYLLYLTASLVDAGRKWLPALSGCGASLLLVSAGLIFASAWTLMASPESWTELWRTKSVAGAATGLGSYYAYKAFADTLGLKPLDLKSCTEQTIADFTGTFYSLADGLDTDTVHYWQFPYDVSMDITNDSGETISYESPYFDGEDSGSLSYGVFIYGDNPLTVMRSSSENAQSGKKIAVIKESYGNAFVPYLTNNYEETHVIDLRSFRDVSSDDLVTYCKKNGITDVLFLNGVMSANTPEQLDKMAGLFN